MLGGRISNHDEDQVEDELEALAREVESTQLPDPPTTAFEAERTSNPTPIQLPDIPDGETSQGAAETRRAKARAKARQDADSHAPEQILA